MNAKKLGLGALLAGVGVFAARAVGPKLHEQLPERVCGRQVLRRPRERGAAPVHRAQVRARGGPRPRASRVEPAANSEHGNRRHPGRGGAAGVGSPRNKHD